MHKMMRTIITVVTKQLKKKTEKNRRKNETLTFGYKSNLIIPWTILSNVEECRRNEFGMQYSECFIIRSYFLHKPSIWELNRSLIRTCMRRFWNKFSKTNIRIEREQHQELIIIASGCFQFSHWIEKLIWPWMKL